jgi:hypothetical protein
MSTIDKNLGSGTNNTTALNTILTVGQGRNIIIYSVLLTNLSTAIITVSLYINDGADRLFEVVKIPAGVGKVLDVKKIKGATLEGNQTIKIQAASADQFNYKINGAERS